MDVEYQDDANNLHRVPDMHAFAHSDKSHHVEMYDLCHVANPSNQWFLQRCSVYKTNDNQSNGVPRHPLAPRQVEKPILVYDTHP